MTSSRHLPVQVQHLNAVLHVPAAGACRGFGSEGPCSAAVTLDAQPACSKVAARSAARAGFSSYNRKAVFPSSRGPSLQSEGWNAGDGLARIGRGAWRRAHPRCAVCLAFESSIMSSLMVICCVGGLQRNKNEP